MSDKKQAVGTLIKGVGGLYEIEIREADGTCRRVHARARGVFRHEKISPLPGDRVEVSLGTDVADKDGGADADTALDKILPRKNALVRPPMANLDRLFLVLPAANPTPMPEVADKLICLCETKGIEPVIVVTKEDLDDETAEKLARLYRRAGFEAFVLSTVTKNGVEEFLAYLRDLFRGAEDKICAFSGASGAGKSSLMNLLFPTLSLEAGELSRKISRGKNTTRATVLYPMSDLLGEGYSGYLADTPGFSMLDFTHGFSFPLNELAHNFREFRPYIGGCRYTKCTHTKEDECAILEAVREGVIPRSRHRSYVAMHNELKQIPEWKRMKMNENK